MCTPNGLLRTGGVLIFYYLPLANNTFFLENINKGFVFILSFYVVIINRYKFKIKGKFKLYPILDFINCCFFFLQRKEYLLLTFCFAKCMRSAAKILFILTTQKHNSSLCKEQNFDFIQK